MASDPLAFLDTSEGSTQSDPLSFLGGDVSRTRSLLSALPKGLIKGASTFSPLPNPGPIPHELGMRLTEQFLPTHEKAPEDILQFAGEFAPAAAFGEGGLVKKGIQALAGGLAKKTAKEAELPEWAQDLVGSLGISLPGAAKAVGSKALRPSSKQKSMVDFLRSEGLSDKDITPIIQNEKKLSWFSKGVSKFEKKDPGIKAIKGRLGDIFEDIRTAGRGTYLQGNDLEAFDTAFHNKLQKVPRMYRSLVKKEIDDLMNNPIDFTELHDFQKAINAIVKNVQGGKAAVGMLKEPLEMGQKMLNPQLYQRLQQTNKAYSSLQNFTDKMTKKNWDGLVKLGQAGGVLLGIVTLNPALIAKGAIGGAVTAAGRSGLTQALTNPRLQNIHLKIRDAVLKNKFPTALSLMELFNSELEKKNLINQDQKNTNIQ